MKGKRKVTVTREKLKDIFVVCFVLYICFIMKSVVYVYELEGEGTWREECERDMRHSSSLTTEGLRGDASGWTPGHTVREGLSPEAAR